MCQRVSVTTPGYSAVGEILSRPDSHKNVSDRVSRNVSVGTCQSERVSQTVSVGALEDEEERRKTKGAFGFTAF